MKKKEESYLDYILSENSQNLYDTTFVQNNI